ncbi:hypothetical protein H0H87_010342, partial [Tephrocybe sp. NHM501043]
VVKHGATCNAMASLWMERINRETNPAVRLLRRISVVWYGPGEFHIRAIRGTRVQLFAGPCFDRGYPHKASKTCPPELIEVAGERKSGKHRDEDELTIKWLAWARTGYLAVASCEARARAARLQKKADCSDRVGRI